MSTLAKTDLRLKFRSNMNFAHRFPDGYRSYWIETLEGEEPTLAEARKVAEETFPEAMVVDHETNRANRGSDRPTETRIVVGIPKPVDKKDARVAYLEALEARIDA